MLSISDLIEPIFQALKIKGYNHFTPVQQKAIPLILQQKDIIGCAQTGTGKTAAFALPLLQLLYGRPSSVSNRAIKALVLTPTRELAIQIEQSFADYGKFTGLRQYAIYGGVPQAPQVNNLKKGVDILIATPGRLLDLINQQLINLRHVEFLVLDEADHMLDMGFIHDVKKIILKTPSQRQTLLFSATMPEPIRKLADTFLRNPSYIASDPVSSTAASVHQSLYFVEKKDKPRLLIHVLNQHADTILVFTRTKRGADKVARWLNQSGVHAEAIHGDKSQQSRQRSLHNFKSKAVRVLVATDIAARGIDISGLPCVINYELPNIPETYVHRIGRTGRAGSSGVAISFCDGEEKAFLKDIQRLGSNTIHVVKDHPVGVSQAITPKHDAGMKKATNADRHFPKRPDRFKRSKPSSLSFTS